MKIQPKKGYYFYQVMKGGRYHIANGSIAVCGNKQAYICKPFVSHMGRLLVCKHCLKHVDAWEPVKEHRVTSETPSQLGEILSREIEGMPDLPEWPESGTWDGVIAGTPCRVSHLVQGEDRHCAEVCTNGDWDFASVFDKTSEFTINGVTRSIKFLLVEPYEVFPDQTHRTYHIGFYLPKAEAPSIPEIGDPRLGAYTGDYMECDTCGAKPGTPTLCHGCLNNRELIMRLKAANKTLDNLLATSTISQLENELQTAKDDRDKWRATAEKLAIELKAHDEAVDMWKNNYEVMNQQCHEKVEERDGLKSRLEDANACLGVYRERDLGYTPDQLKTILQAAPPAEVLDGYTLSETHGAFANYGNGERYDIYLWREPIIEYIEGDDIVDALCQKYGRLPCKFGPSLKGVLIYVNDVTGVCTILSDEANCRVWAEHRDTVHVNKADLT